MDECAPHKTEPKHPVAASILGTSIRDEADFNRHIDYIHWNPVKHGYVAEVSHWPYSSFHRYVKQGWLPANGGINIESLNGADFGE